MSIDKDSITEINFDLARAELEFVTSITTYLFWTIKDRNGEFEVMNGSVFFVDVGNGPFGVTACHVIDGLLDDMKGRDFITSQLGECVPFDIHDKNRCIDSNKEIDIATFRITSEEIRLIRKVIFCGIQEVWPPGPPAEGCGVCFSGFPGGERRVLSQNVISFGAAPGSGLASSVSEKDISTQLDRDHLIPILGRGIPPENFAFGGMSGGPMLTKCEKNGVASWSLAGVIYQGPNTSFDPSEGIAGCEIIKARRAHFILQNGMLDTQRWNSLKIR